MTTETKNKVLTRDQVKVEETWRLEDIFATDEAWEEEFKEIEELSTKAETYKGTLNQGADAFMMRFLTVIHLSKNGQTVHVCPFKS